MVVGEAALDVINRHRQIRPEQEEAGGVLLGRIGVGGDIRVDVATEPSKMDGRSRFWFRRARRPTQELIDSAWKESEGYRNYLGEWHTHPEGVPKPSSVDIDGWSKLAKRAEYEQDALIFLILGQRALRAWEIEQGQEVVVELEPVLL